MFDTQSFSFFIEKLMLKVLFIFQFYCAVFALCSIVMLHIWNKSHNNLKQTFLFWCLRKQFPQARHAFWPFWQIIYWQTRNKFLSIYSIVSNAPMDAGDYNCIPLSDWTLARFKHLGIAKQQRPQLNANFNCETSVLFTFWYRR